MISEHPDFHTIFSDPPRWRLINEPLADSAEAALLRDSLLLREVAEGKRGATARLWEAPQSLIVTRKETRFPRFEEACQRLAAEDWPVNIRDSGGTSVPLQPGILNFSLIFPQTEASQYNLDQIYLALCEPIRGALSQLGLQADYGETPGSYCDGRYNLNVDGLKVTGTAQRYRISPPNQRGVRQGVLAQAMLMVEADAEAGTAQVNRFYRLAGNERQFNPAVATSLTRLLPSASKPSGMLTLRLRQLIASEFQQLVQTASS
ncbi:lipoate--protein ligase family protein [Neptuniibacter halophilus]|uniref:lipoate--protein ligase family protein n=1 Tax=Neptuniibacter halophilus TaxID=651666 RepID=UPI0025731D1C|nr:hypothetical protein [Neptuniibacter halophilus]